MSLAEKTIDIAGWAELREQAIGLIQVMNSRSRQWTDYNTHDPGITLLETLCYAISDLSNRIALPIEDLLCPSPGKAGFQTGSQGAHKTFFTAQQVLPNSPFTLDDYRRWLIDQAGVNNAWLHYSIESASYFVFLYLDSSLGEEICNEIEDRLLLRLTKEKSVGERFALVKALPLVPVNISLDISLNNNVNIKVVKSELLKCINQFFSLVVSTKSFSQMGSLGQNVETTLSGPLPVNGFVTQEALTRTNVNGFDDKIQPVFKYDFLELEERIKQIIGVSTIHVSSLAVGNKEVEFDGQDSNKIHLVVAKLASLESVSLTLTQNNFTEIIKRSVEPNQRSIKQASDIAIEFPKGKFQNLSAYTSIQDDLPEYYGLGQNTLSDQQDPDKTLKRCNEEVTQLRNYLTLFDQTICDYFAQLGHVNGMLAMVQPLIRTPPQAIFTQKLPSSALTDSEAFYSSLKDEYDSNSRIKQQNFTQKNALLDHLLALFSETYIPQNVYMRLKGLLGSIENSDYLFHKQQYLNIITLLRSSRSQTQALSRIIALKLGLSDEDNQPNNQVVITDLAALQPLPIPCNEISSEDLTSPQFKVADSTNEWLSKISIQLPTKFKPSGNNDPSLDSLNSYAKSILDSELPAHIYYEVTYSDELTDQAGS